MAAAVQRLMVMVLLLMLLLLLVLVVVVVVEWRRRRVLQLEIIGGHPVAEKRGMTIEHKEHTGGKGGYIEGREDRGPIYDILVPPNPLITSHYF